MQDPTSHDAMSTDTPMDTPEKKSKGKMPIGDDAMDDDDEEDESEEDEEVSNIPPPLVGRFTNYRTRTMKSPKVNNKSSSLLHIVYTNRCIGAAEEDADEDNMEEIDLDNIVGSRTRGKNIDYAQAAKDLEGQEDDEDDEDDDDFQEDDAMEE